MHSTDPTETRKSVPVDKKNPVSQKALDSQKKPDRRPEGPVSQEAPGNQKNPDRWPEGLGSRGPAQLLLNFNAFFYDFY